MKSDVLYFDYENLLEHLEDQPSYVFIDKAEVVPGKSVKASKCFTYNEWFFKCHFPGNAIVPGVFQLEAIMQAASLPIHTISEDIGVKFYTKKFKDVDILAPVRPGDKLFIEAEIESFKRGIIKASGFSYVLENSVKKVTCRATFILTAPDIISKFSPEKKV